MGKYSSEYIKKKLEHVILSTEEQDGNYLFYEALLTGLYFTFCDKSVDLNNDEELMQLILFLKQCPPLIQIKVLRKLPELDEFFTEVQFSSLESLTKFTS